MKRLEFDHRVTDQGILFFKCKDNRSVHLLSNYHGNEKFSIKRTQKDGTKLDIFAPCIVRDYNKHMGGIDKADMLRSFYDLYRKSKKCWYRLFFAFIEMCLINSYVAYKETREKILVLDFKRKVTQGLITLTRGDSKKTGRPSLEQKCLI